MVPLATLLVLRPTEATPDEAFGAATRVLTAFDVPEPYTLDRKVSGPPNGIELDFVVRAGDESRYEARVLKATGQCLFLMRKGWHDQEPGAPRPAGVRAPAEQLARAERALRRLLKEGTITPLGSSEMEATNSFSASLIVEDYPFLAEWNEPPVVRLDAKTGGLLEYSDSGPHPNFDFAKPALNERRATSTAERFLHLRPPKRPTQWYVERTTEIDPETARRNAYFDSKRQLGWYVVRGMGRARLAWRVPFVARWRTACDTHSSQSYALQMVHVDAATAQILDPPIFDADGMPRP